MTAREWSISRNARSCSSLADWKGRKGGLPGGERYARRRQRRRQLSAVFRGPDYQRAEEWIWATMPTTSGDRPAYEGCYGCDDHNTCYTMWAVNHAVSVQVMAWSAILRQTNPKFLKVEWLCTERISCSWQQPKWSGAGRKLCRINLLKALLAALRPARPRTSASFVAEETAKWGQGDPHRDRSISNWPFCYIRQSAWRVR